MLQEAEHLRTDGGVHGIEGAVHHDVVFVDFGVGIVEPVVQVVLVEEIFGLVLAVEESERDGRLAVGIHVHVVGVHMVVFEKLYDVPTHSVVAGLADERGVDASPAERNDAVEHRAARHCADGLLVFENDVEYGLAYTYNFSHGNLLLMFAVNNRLQI